MSNDTGNALAAIVVWLIVVAFASVAYGLGKQAGKIEAEKQQIEEVKP